MAETTLAEQLAEAIALLTKVSTQQTKKEKKYSTVAKVTKVEEEKEQKQDKTEKMVEKLSRVVAADQAKPKEVVEEGKPVSIVDIDKKVMTKLGKIFTPPEAEPMPEKLEKEESGLMGWIRKLLGPALLILGGLASFIMGLFSDGPLKGFFTMLGKLGIKQALAMMAKKLGMFIGKKLLKRIPIIGSILGFADAYFRFKKDDYVGGSIALLSGLAALLDLAVPGLGTTLSFGLDVLNAMLDAKTAEEVDPKKRTAAKLGLLKDWAVNIGKFLAELPIIRNFVQFGEGVGDIIAGNYKEGFLKMSYALPFFGYFANFIGLPETKEQADILTKDMSFGDIFNKAMQPIYTKILTYLPSWMQDLISVDEKGNLTFTPKKMVEGITNRITDTLGLTNQRERDVAKEAGAGAVSTSQQNAARAREKLEEFNALYPGTDQPEEILAERKRLLDQYKALKEKSDKMVKEVGDFIATPDGKILQPDKNDTVIGFKPDGPMDKYFDKTAKLTTENNDILKKLGESQTELLTKQLKVLERSNQLLTNMVEKLQQQPVNNTRTNIINNTFGDNMSLRNLQAVAT